MDPHTVTAALGQALRDPDLRVFFHARHPASLVDGDGMAADPPPVPPGRVADLVELHGGPVALLVHAPADPALLAAVTRAGAGALEHARLQAELAVQLAEVRASRTRLVTAADGERRRIERDLHDGAQQRMVGLALHIQSARRRENFPTRVADLLAFTVEQLHAGLEDIRMLVHGIQPPALAASGLAAALEELAHPGDVTLDSLPGTGTRLIAELPCAL